MLRSPAAPLVDRLESRRLFASTAQIVNRQLRVIGTDAAENFVITAHSAPFGGGATSFTLTDGNGLSFDFTPSQVKSFFLEALGGNDTINLGSLSVDTGIVAGAGNDVVFGGPGRDRIDMGDGDDWATGSTNADTVNGDAGDDHLFGDTGDDVMGGGDDRDAIWGGDGNDRISGNGGPDTIRGDDGDDLIHGNAGNDLLYGCNGNNRVYGEEGNDRFQCSITGTLDHLDGGSGSDYAIVQHNEDTLTSIETAP